MKDFSRPEYASYIALCERLQLQHRLEANDIFYEHTPPGVISKSGVAHVLVFNQHEYRWLEKDLGEFWYWLPTLSDWLDKMLEEELCQGFSLWKRTGLWACRPINGGAIDYDYDPEDAPTPEEAAARLWLDIVSGLAYARRHLDTKEELDP